MSAAATALPTQKKGYLPTLDGWRAIAILLVIASHTGGRLFGAGGQFQNVALAHRFEFGNKGVDLFFGISGFLICARLIEERESRGRISLRDFYVRRAFRILPPVWLYLGVLAVLTLAGVLTALRSEILAALLFVRNYVLIAHSWQTSHLWSLAVEEHFYLLFPSLLVLWGIRDARWRLPVAAVLIAIWRRLILPPAVSDPLANATFNFYWRTDVRLDALLWGCWMATLVAHPGIRARLERWTDGWRLGAVGLLTLYVAASGIHGAMPLQNFLVPIVLTGTVLHPGTAFGRALEWAPLRWLGRISYSLYLWQQLFLPPRTEVQRLGILQDLPFGIFAAVLVAAASYYALERPMMRLGHRLARPVTAGRPDAEPVRG